ncbi:macro domain-containing protein [Lagierella sp.]|uniref:macro domain-containing protein n=1 Tax=Lagierella sp. TaxID=2849657 RepID=UPI00260A60CB|nr:macro domain-containing protein [Lagierella sp.]
MDIRYTLDKIFDVESEAIVYFAKNSLLEGSQELINRAGLKALESLTKLQGCPTGDVKIIPGYDLSNLYILLTVLPHDIKSNINKILFDRAFNEIIRVAKEYDIKSLAINLTYLKEKYGKDYIESLNKVLHSKAYKFDDFIVYLCR